MLKICEIHKKIGEKYILNNINLQIQQGESIVIIGESGGGKTTLAKIIAGIESPSKGTLYYCNEELLDSRKRAFSQCGDIQYIFQDPYSSLEKNYTVRKTLLEPFNICKRNGRSALNPEEAMAMVDKNLLEYIDCKIDILSGGQRQKVAIARALVPMPKIIIADECTAMLDADSSQDIFSVFQRLNEERNITIIAIVHEIDFLRGFWKRIIVVKEGTIIEDMLFKDFYYEAKDEYSKEIIQCYQVKLGFR